MEITDIHCHILPGMDDGAKDEEESLALVRMAWEQGVEAFIATPHYSRQFRNDCPERIREKCEKLEKEARETIASEIRIYPGQEICWEESVPEKLDRGELLTLADSSYVLVEYLPSVSYGALFRNLRTLRLEGYLPILAHAERYGALRTEGLEELTEAGVCVQMNYGSIGTSLFDKDQRWCRKQLKEGNIHFLGTDMHSVHRRPPRVAEAMKWLETHLSGEELSRICRDHAGQVLTNQNL